MLTRKSVQNHLVFWGQFWARQEFGMGYASISVTSRCCEILKTGIQSNGTSHLFSSAADEMHIPLGIKLTDDCVSKLTNREQHWIKEKYIKQLPIDNIFIDRAEAALSGLMG